MFHGDLHLGGMFAFANHGNREKCVVYGLGDGLTCRQIREAHMRLFALLLTVTVVATTVFAGGLCPFCPV